MSSPLLISKLNSPVEVFTSGISQRILSLVPSSRLPSFSGPILLATVPFVKVSNSKATSPTCVIILSPVRVISNGVCASKLAADKV